MPPIDYSIKKSASISKKSMQDINMNMRMEYPAVDLAKDKSKNPELFSSNDSGDAFPGPEKKSSTLFQKSSSIVELTSAMMMHSLADTMTNTLGGCVSSSCCAVSDESKEKLTGVIPMALDITSKLTAGVSYAWSAFSAVLDPKNLGPVDGSADVDVD